MLGTVSSLRYPEFWTVATFRIEELLKGNGGGDALDFWLPGGPFPSADYGFTSASLMHHVPFPLILPGYRALLLLDHEAWNDGLWVQPYSGEYLLRKGRIRAIDANDFGRSVNGLSEKTFLDLVRSQLRK